MAKRYQSCLLERLVKKRIRCLRELDFKTAENEYVERQVDKHFEQAKEAGAKILQGPRDQFYGDRTYGAEDPEGHHWYFAQHVHDVAPEDMKPSA